jgi:hypothetical protein
MGWNRLQELQTTSKPDARANHTMAYVADRGTVVVFGGSTLAGQVGADTWELSGSAWTLLDPSPRADGRSIAAMAYDAARRELVLFGGGGNGPALTDTWVMQFVEPAHRVDACTAGFDVDGDGLLGCAEPSCAGLCEPLCASLALCSTGPRCGDGVCDPLETCRLCAADCGVCNVCGDLHCDAGETCSSCAGDCAVCP